jgi:hypothetical protein
MNQRLPVLNRDVSPALLQNQTRIYQALKKVPYKALGYVSMY